MIYIFNLLCENVPLILFLSDQYYRHFNFQTDSGLHCSKTYLSEAKSVITCRALYLKVICFGWTCISRWTLGTVLLSSFTVCSIWTFHLITGWSNGTTIPWRAPGARLQNKYRFNKTKNLDTRCEALYRRFFWILVMLYLKIPWIQA